MDAQQNTDKAIKEAKKLKKAVACWLVDDLHQEEMPVSVFMAGSPGAGKTETARAMIRAFADEHRLGLVHIENGELSDRVWASTAKASKADCYNDDKPFFIAALLLKDTVTTNFWNLD